MNNKTVYAIRDKSTGELINSKCAGSGKFYSVRGFAKRWCDEYNKRESNKFEVVTYELVEIKNS